jgi:sugar phosphate isomerase/epimerase
MTTPIAVQLYTLRDMLTQDYEGTVRKVADLGYIGVETANLFGGSPASAAKLFRELGLTVTSAHSGLPLGDKKQEVLDTLAALDCKRLILPGAPEEMYQSREGIQRLCDSLNEAAMVGKANGFQVGYHNHVLEYQLLQDRLRADLMLELLDPEVFFEVDVYWVKTAGYDPVQVVHRLGSRAPFLHIKDGPCQLEEPMKALGEGVMDLPGIVAAGAGSTEWLVVELDECATDMLEAVRKSYRYLIDKGLGHGNQS